MSSCFVMYKDGYYFSKKNNLFSVFEHLNDSKKFAFLWFQGIPWNHLHCKNARTPDVCSQNYTQCVGV